MVSEKNPVAANPSVPSPSSVVRFLSLGLVLLALVGLPAVSHASPAADITVTTTTDEFDAGAGCSLREAIQAANIDAAFGGCPAGNGYDIIELPAGAGLAAGQK